MSDRTIGVRSAFVIRDGSVLRCANCGRPVGFIRWDGNAWPHPIVTRPACPECGLQQILSLEALEAATVDRYRPGADARGA